MRGYRLLRDSSTLHRIADVNRAFTTQNLNIDSSCFSRHLFGAGIGQAELVCRQYLLARVAGINLNKTLLYALGKPGASVVYHLPPAWRDILRLQGFKVPEFRSSLLWYAFVFMMFGYGILKIGQIITRSIKASIKQEKQASGRYVYFDSLVPGTLPQPCQDGRSHDIITWYMQWSGRCKDVETLCHSVKDAKKCDVNGAPVISVSGPLPLLLSGAQHFNFLVWSMKAALIATFDFLCGRWWHALLLNQAALSAQARIQDSDSLAKDYLFHNSGWIYRPLWTYEAEKSGSRFILYFYSTNCEPFKRADGYPPPYYGYQAMNWPLYLVWDEYQADFVRRVVGDAANITIVGPIWFHSNAEEMPTFNGRGIAVFDVTPHRSSRFRTLGLDTEFYVPEVCIPFLHGTQQTANSTGYTVFWKCKRKIGSIAHPRYRYHADKIAACDNVESVDPDISAQRVIEASVATISMPFTSTALIAREIGKPSCYYDPTGLLKKDDRAAHGIEIINTLEELATWLKTAV
jgi:polysaccharide biosynthesis PFTS motif protein